MSSSNYLNRPNMSGKTSYLRQLGLTAILTQLGAHIPCTGSAEIPIFQSILTRIGSYDNVIRGESSFESEARELAAIAKQAKETKEPMLILIDEIGRTTDARSGVALLAAMVKAFVVRHSPIYAVISTHYHNVFDVLSKFLSKEEIQRISFCRFSGIASAEGAFQVDRKLRTGVSTRSYGLESISLLKNGMLSIIQI